MQGLPQGYKGLIVISLAVGLQSSPMPIVLIVLCSNSYVVDRAETVRACAKIHNFEPP